MSENIGTEVSNSQELTQPQPTLWSRVADRGMPIDGSRIHAKVDGRYVTIFRHQGKLSCIDSICHHAGGPLTLGRLQDIEDLGVTVVLCPWHAFMVTIDGGLKAYKAAGFKNGKAYDAGWKIGKVVQRPHLVEERDDGTYVVSPCPHTSLLYGEPVLDGLQSAITMHPELADNRRAV